MSNKVKLSILGISFSQVQAGAYALIFAEEGGVRRLPIVVGTPEAQSIAIVMENIEPPRPLSHDVICDIFNNLNVELQEVFIYKYEDGAFFAQLILHHNGTIYKIDSRTSDAVAIALRTNSNIYTTEKIMEDMAIVFDEKMPLTNETKSADEIEDSMDTNISSLQIEVLKERLKDAINNEEYELAIKLRDEINKRENG